MQTSKSPGPHKNMVQNSFLSVICQSTQDVLQPSTDFLFRVTHQSASHSSIPDYWKLLLAAVLSRVCPYCLLHVSLSASI